MYGVFVVVLFSLKLRIFKNLIETKHVMGLLKIKVGLVKKVIQLLISQTYLSKQKSL